MDWSATGWARVYVFTALGTGICIVFAFAFDSYSFTKGTWQFSDNAINNLLIPLLIGPPFFFVLLNKMRQLAIAHRELLTVAMTDGLTSLLNRRAFTEMVDGYLKRAKLAGAPSYGALLAIDVDHFKTINDTFGHDIGDEALKLIAKSIVSAVRETDLVGRVGGEEFCVFIPGQSPESVRTVAERIRSAINETVFDARGKPYRLSVSIGGVVFDRDTTFDDLYRDADKRLYRAKETGRNRVELRAFSSEVALQATATVH
jgi:diguanylate cyclase (GGDEF)-like protein